MGPLICDACGSATNQHDADRRFSNGGIVTICGECREDGRQMRDVPKTEVTHKYDV